LSQEGISLLDPVNLHHHHYRFATFTATAPDGRHAVTLTSFVWSVSPRQRAQQRIVYLTNPHVGHLGIFVSATVARFEHRAILEHLGEIEALEPGLYEMKIDNPTGDPDCERDQYAVRFKPRRIVKRRWRVRRRSSRCGAASARAWRRD
jgi:hypothetical protein